MGSTDSTLNMRTLIENTTNNECASVTCSGTQNITIGARIHDSTINQQCAAKQTCQIKTIIDQIAEQGATLKLTSGALATSRQQVKRDLTTRLVNTINNKCGSVGSSNVQNVNITPDAAGSYNLTINQFGDAQADCYFDTLMKIKQSQKDDQTIENSGLLKFLENLTGNPLFVVVLGVVALKMLAPASGGGGAPIIIRS